jgi:hypothetical protein
MDEVELLPSNLTTKQKVFPAPGGVLYLSWMSSFFLPIPAAMKVSDGRAI